MTKRRACEKVVPAPYHRQTVNKPMKAKPTPAADYRPGFFTELVLRHRWPPRFESKT